MILTRNIDGQGQGGRIGTIRRVIAAANEISDVTIVQIRPFLEQRHYFRFAWRVLKSLLSPKRSLPLQCLLFDDTDQVAAVEKEILRIRPTAVYFDSIRCATTVCEIQRRFPHLRLVCDFDDLMSRRCSLTLSIRRGFSMGYLSHYVPRVLRMFVESHYMSHIILKWEEIRLLAIERRLTSIAHSITLVSTVDAKLLADMSAAPDRCKVMVVPPPFSVVHLLEAPVSPLRFIFIGTDKLLQNRLTIEWLLRLWQEEHFDLKLHIIGAQLGRYDPCDNVVFEGFVPQLSDVYSRNSILFAPSFLGGGVKTKIAEALSYGVIPLGNELSFEGMGLSENPLALSLDELRQAPRIACERVGFWTDCAKELQMRLSETHSVAEYRDRWREAITGEKRPLSMELTAIETSGWPQ